MITVPPVVAPAHLGRSRACPTGPCISFTVLLAGPAARRNFTGDVAVPSPIAGAGLPGLLLRASGGLRLVAAASENRLTDHQANGAMDLITFTFCSAHFFRSLPGEAHREHRALAGLALHRDVTAHHLAEAPADNQAKAGPPVFARRR